MTKSPEESILEKKKWSGVCGVLPKTISILKPKSVIFPYPTHLTRNSILFFKT